MSRSSNLGLNRTSYYGRATGGKSLGNVVNTAPDDDEMEIDGDVSTPQKGSGTEDVAAHNKSYTQRLQDQISMLGKSQPRPERLSRSIPNFAPTTPAPPPQSPEQSKASSPIRKPATPGAFPEEDDEDWIQPPATSQPPMKEASPGPAVPPKDDPVDAAMSDAATDFVLPKQRPQSRPGSPQRPPAIPERTTSAISHVKSASVSALPDKRQPMDDDASPKKTISVSNPTLAPVSETEQPETPKSATRSVRESPLKHVKNKLSSILKSSKGLLASSAALSAEGKTSMLSPSPTRPELTRDPSSETVNQAPPTTEPVYPNLTQALVDAQTSGPASPTKPDVRKTRASAEREKREKQKEKETRMMEDQMEKLEKAREKEAEKARIFNQEKERIAAMEKQVAAQKEQERKRAATAKATPQPARTSPQKTKTQAQVGDGDVEMQDATASMPVPPPATVSRPTTSGPAQSARKEPKRPVRPTKETASKSKAAPTVIKVNMGPHHSQYHPSNTALSANLGEALGPSSSKQPASKASQPNLKSKGSAQSLKSSASSAGRPKALELAAKRREQEEREAQRKREAKAEMDRKRAAQQEEERRQEQQRRLEAEKKREKEREAAEAKKAAQRQAAIEKAKQTRAPPPPVRSQPNGPPDYSASAGQESAGGKAGGPSRPPSRMGSAMFRSQEDVNRPVNTVLSNANKGQKRPLGQDADTGNSRAQQTRNGPTYQGKDAKRRRTSQEPDDNMEDVPNINRPPVRPSAGYKKVRLLTRLGGTDLADQVQDMPAKAMYASGYTTGPQSVTRDLFKSTVTSQHNSAIKSNALDTTQFSKGAIPFAPNPSQQAYKTPGRPGPAVPATKSTAKSAPRSSPRFQNGDAIELPEIQTDDEDEDSEAEAGTMASWADSPDLRRALLRQETMDPAAIFGPPAPLNMEEVFSKSKDRWHKFRQRTSSANWSGTDKLTEEDIRKDMAARDRLRREGGWTYEMSREL